MKKQMKRRKVMILIISFLLSTSVFVVLLTLDVLLAMYISATFHEDLFGTGVIISIVTMPFVLWMAEKVLKSSIRTMKKRILVKLT